MDKMTDYFGDMTKFYDGTEDTLIGGILKGITKPIVKLNHKHIVGRAMTLLEGRKDPKTGEDLSKAQIDILTGILKMNPGGMIQGAFNLGGRPVSTSTLTKFMFFGILKGIVSCFFTTFWTNFLKIGKF